MANTYTQIYIQVVFVVDGRANIIPTKNKVELNKYISGIIKERGHKSIIVNGMSDHIHIFIGYNPDESLSTLVKEVKRCSANFINNNNWVIGKFAWQSGYGGFSYSRSHIDNVYEYIENQENHHKRRTFREEYIEFLQKYEITYDERFIFKDVL